MEEDKNAAVDPSEGEKHGGGDPGEGPSDEVGDAVGLPRGGASTETEGSSAIDNSGDGVASENVRNDDLEEPSPESEGVTAVGSGGGHGTASDGDKDEHHEVPKNPIATRFAFRATDANATPVSTYRHMLSRSRKRAGPTRFVAAGASASAGPETPAPSTSSPELVTGPPEDASAVPDADHGAAQGGEKKKYLEVVEKQSEARFVSGHTAANAMPPSTFRIRPSRSRKQSSPTRSIVREADPPPPGLLAVISSAPDAAAPAASSSHRAPSRGRKQPRPERFVPEEGEAAARAKARRSGIALDRFITSQLNDPSGPRTEWEKEVTAADVGDQRERGTMRDQHSISIPVSESGQPQGPEVPPDDRRRIYGVLAVLGASLALSMLACVLFYITGTESPPSDQNQECMAPMEEAPELIGPRISFSHDGVVATAGAAQQAQTMRLDASLTSSRRLPETEFDFANAAAADVAPADRLFAGGKLLPVPPLPPIHPKSSPCKQQASSSSVKAPPQPSHQRRPGSWTSPFTRSCSVNSATTAATTTTAPRSASGSFSCPSFQLMRSRSAGSAGASQGGFGSVVSAGGHRPQHKKAGAPAAASNSGSTRPAYYYGGSRNGSSGHGVRVSPVINVPSIGTSMVNMLSYLLCDCGNKTTKNRGFGVNC
ncbi:hypothetical protein E2562_023585 [Oryza meyeriana var. granulata]|uniref:Uncharacterized protein n=1 Tax=Oryza meyeriana var. granulata TaxID=110450 RepID=A0A6G1E0W8_9ORYZ|nr:hypothetical protein E2562_023585 [Oryza meyeriana var. granulata]